MESDKGTSCFPVYWKLAAKDVADEAETNPTWCSCDFFCFVSFAFTARNILSKGGQKYVLLTLLLKVRFRLFEVIWNNLACSCNKGIQSRMKGQLWFINYDTTHLNTLPDSRGRADRWNTSLKMSEDVRVLKHFTCAENTGATENQKCHNSINEKATYL